MHPPNTWKQGSLSSWTPGKLLCSYWRDAAAVSGAEHGMSSQPAGEARTNCSKSTQTLKCNSFPTCCHQGVGLFNKQNRKHVSHHPESRSLTGRPAILPLFTHGDVPRMQSHCLKHQYEQMGLTAHVGQEQHRTAMDLVLGPVQSAQPHYCQKLFMHCFKGPPCTQGPCREVPFILPGTESKDKLRALPILFLCLRA